MEKLANMKLTGLLILEKLLYHLTTDIYFGYKDYVCQGEGEWRLWFFSPKEKRQNGDVILETHCKSIILQIVPPTTQFPSACRFYSMALGYGNCRLILRTNVTRDKNATS